MVCLREVMKFNVVSFHSDSLVLFTVERLRTSGGSTGHHSAGSETSYSYLKVMSYYFFISTICLCLAYQNFLRISLIGCFTLS